MASTPPGDSLLAVDFGSTTTRALLFDVVDGVYRFVAAGRAPTTFEAPFVNVSEGLRHALDDLKAITGRAFLDQDEQLILPARANGSGVDALVATTSAGPPLRTVILGLLPDTSVESARRAAATTYANVVEVIGLGDRRREEQQVDAILRLKPDLAIIAGGTDGGSTEAVMGLAETVGLACEMRGPGRRLYVLFAGNTALRNDVTRLLGSQAEVRTALNVRPTLDLEDIVSARHELAALYTTQRLAGVPGYDEVARWTAGGAGLLPTANAFGRLAQFLSRRDDAPGRAYDPSNGVLGVDLGSAHTTFAAAWQGRLWLNVCSGLGVGHSAQSVLEQTTLDRITRWLPVEISAQAAREYALDKALHPGTIPQEGNELYLEHALAREALRLALGQVRPTWPRNWPGGQRGLSKTPVGLPWFEPILASGAVLGGAPHVAQAALILLDGLEPTGVTSLLLDVFGSLAAALGAAAPVNPLATAQVLESGALLNLATVVAPAGGTKRGGVAVRVKMAYSNGETANVEVAHGALQTLRLPAGQTATLTLQPGHDLDLGRGPGRPVVLRQARGGALGVIVDARGRPLRLAQDAGRRREMNQKWLWDLGG